MLKNIATGLTLAMLLGAPLRAQDTKAQPTDPKSRLKSALEKTAATSGLKIEGAMGVQLPAGEKGPRGGDAGMFTGLLTSAGDAELRFEGDRSLTEVWRVAGKTATRTTNVSGGAAEGGENPAGGERDRARGRGGRRGGGDAAREIGRILDLKGVLTQLEKIEKIEDKGSESVGGKKCTLLSATYKPPKAEGEGDAPPAPDEGGGRRNRDRGGRGDMFGTRQITARFWIDDADGVIRKMGYDIERGPSDEMIDRLKKRAERGGGGGNGDNPMPPDDGGNNPPPDGGGGGRRMPNPDEMIVTTSYEVEFMEFLTDAKVSVPAEIQKLLDK